MRKALILGAVLLILAGALFVAANNLNRYLAENRDWLAEQASSALGRSVAFDEIGVSLRGGLGARVTSVAIGEDPAFGNGEFLRADRIDAVIKILPALRGRYEVARVEIDAPEINVIKTRSGFNFDSLGRAAGDRAPTTEPDTPAGALPFLVSSLRISDGRMQFTDRSASPASELSVDRLDFSASDVGLDRPIQLELKAAVLGVAEQNVRAEGTLGPLDSPEAAASAPIDLRVDLGPIVVDRLKKLALIGESIPAELSSPDPIALSVKLSGNADALSTIVSMDASGAAISYGDQFAKPKDVRFTVDADVRQVGDAIDVAKFDLHLAKAHLTGRGRIGLTPGMPVDFKLSGRDLPLDGWGRLIPAAAAVEATGALDLDLAAKGPIGGGRIPRLDGTLGLQQVSVNQFSGDTKLDALTTTVTFAGDRAEIPPTDFKLNGNPVRIAATVRHQASRRGQKFTLEQLALSVFDGSINGVGSYDMAASDEPAFSFRGKVDGIDVGALVAHFGAGRALKMSGRLQGSFDLDGRGSEWEVIRRALTGSGALEVADGVLEGVNIAESVLGDLTGIPGLGDLISPNVRNKYPELFGMDDTVFEMLTGKMTLKDGQALLEEIALAARDYRLNGKGTIGLDKALDIGITFVASQNLTGDLIRSAKAIQYLTDANGRFNLPLRIGGSMPKIRAQPDLQYVTRQLSSSLVQTGLSKRLDALIGKKRASKPEADGGAEPPAEQPPAQPDPAEELIRRGLGALLGGDQE
jgi:uncharacterized protein involved in outer membrane biogenesis